jgi:hypothetical protein
MMKSTILDEPKKATIDSSYMMYKMKRREISPIVANTSKLQTSINMLAKSELHKTQLKTVSPDKEYLSTKMSTKQLDLKKVLAETKLKGIKGLPIKYLSEAIKTKTLSSFPSSDRYTKNKFVKKK